MPIYTIGTPDGRKLRIEAPDEATALRGAEEWSAQNSVPAAPPAETIAPVAEIPAQEAYNPLQRLGESAYNTGVGALQGMTMGAYDEVASALGTPVKAIEGLMSGTDSIQGAGDILPFLGRSYDDSRQGQAALTDQAYASTPVAAFGGDIAGSMATGLLTGGANNYVNVAKPTVMGMAGRGALDGATMGGISGFNDAPEDTLGSRLSSAGQGAAIGGALGAVTGGVAGGIMQRAQMAAVPETQELADQAGRLYQAARDSGVTASPQMTTDIANTIESIARAENVVMPSGKVNQTYPKIAGVLNVFDEYKGNPLDVGQMQAIRRNLQDAAKSLDPGERRIASMMLGEFDDFAQGVAPELAEASSLYARSKVGELIEEAIDLAGNRSSQYSQSGMDNALRTQFRQLNANIIKGRVRGINPELAEQIARVAEGGPVENFARWAGKFSARGPVSAIPSILAGGAGFAGGGPVGAALAGGAVALPAEIARNVAERGTVRNANVASALARMGGALPSQEFTPVARALINAGGNVGGRVLPNF